MQCSEVCVSPKSHWQQLAEGVSIAGSLTGVVATAVTNQVLYASVPLALAVLLSRLNRHQDWQASQQQRAQVVTQLAQVEEQQQFDFAKIELGLTEVKHVLADQQQQVQQQVNNLTSSTQVLQEAQHQLVNLTRTLQDFEIYSQSIRLNPHQADTFYQRGLLAHQLGAFEGAVEDFSEAIRLNATFAAAYQHRALSRIELSERQAAVTDLRLAARYFFDQGDLTNYQNSRNLSKLLHQGTASQANAEAHTPDLSLTQECLLV